MQVAQEIRMRIVLVQLHYLCTTWYADDENLACRTKQAHFKRCMATVSLYGGVGRGGEGQSRIKEPTLNHSEMMAQVSPLCLCIFSHFVVGIFLPLTNCLMLSAMSSNFWLGTQPTSSKTSEKKYGFNSIYRLEPSFALWLLYWR
jgi:hypothetical protein